MSATSQGFVHYFEAKFLNLHGQGGHPKSWAERLPDFIMQDFQVPTHITMKTAEPLIMGCKKCGMESPALNPHGAVRGWYPNETVSIRCEGIGTWTTNHTSK